MPRTAKNLILRVRWTPEKLKQVADFLDEERKYPGPDLMQFMEDFERVDGEITWKRLPIIADPVERQTILKDMYYDESRPSGISKMIRAIHTLYIGFKAEEVRAFVHKQKSYQDTRTVFKSEASMAMIVPIAPFHTVETDLTFYSQNAKDLKANSGVYILSTYVDQFSKWSWATWVKNKTGLEVSKALKRFLRAVPREFKVQNILHDQGAEYKEKFVETLRGAFVEKLYGKGYIIKNKVTAAGAPAKHVESLNRSIREAATKFRTTYSTKRIKDFVPVYVQRLNKHQEHERTLKPPIEILMMARDKDEEGLKKVRNVMIRRGAIRNRQTGQRMRKIKKGDRVRVVSDEYRRIMEKSKLTKKPPGIRWEKKLRLVTAVSRGRIQLQMDLFGKKVWHARNHVQLVPENSAARKTYDDRPVLDDKHDPERKELRPNDPNPEPNAEEKRLLIAAKKKSDDKAAQALEKKLKRRGKAKKARAAKRVMNLPRAENRHSINAFFALKKARGDS